MNYLLLFAEDADVVRGQVIQPLLARGEANSRMLSSLHLSITQGRARHRR